MQDIASLIAPRLAWPPAFISGNADGPRSSLKCWDRASCAAQRAVNRSSSFQRRTVRPTRYPVPLTIDPGRIAGAARRGTSRIPRSFSMRWPALPARHSVPSGCRRRSKKRGFPPLFGEDHERSRRPSDRPWRAPRRTRPPPRRGAAAPSTRTELASRGSIRPAPIAGEAGQRDVRAHEGAGAARRFLAVGIDQPRLGDEHPPPAADPAALGDHRSRLAAAG